MAMQGISALMDFPHRVASAIRSAQESGALAPIVTESTVLADGGVDFSVRWVSSLTRKDEARRVATAPDFNPFLPYEPGLFVGELGPGHVALLNKFPVIANHALIVTRAFEAQLAPLNLADFSALAAAMASADWLAFYNGGELAGASQRHKHLQLAPLAADGSGRCPIEALLPATAPAGVATRLTALPFAHAFVALDASRFNQPGEAAAMMLDAWQAACAHAAVSCHAGQMAPYNLLLRRGWLLLVPRRAERWEGISINALGFAGSLFVKHRDDIERIRVAGPMRVLAAVAGSATRESPGRGLS